MKRSPVDAIITANRGIRRQLTVRTAPVKRARKGHAAMERSAWGMASHVSAEGTKAEKNPSAEKVRWENGISLLDFLEKILKRSEMESTRAIISSQLISPTN
jgi:hypothetical protein